MTWPGRGTGGGGARPPPPPRREKFEISLPLNAISLHLTVNSIAFCLHTILIVFNTIALCSFLTRTKDFHCFYFILCFFPTKKLFLLHALVKQFYKRPSPNDRLFCLISLEDSRGHPLKFGGRRVFCINHTWKGSKLKIRCVPHWHCWAFRDFNVYDRIWAK